MIKQKKKTIGLVNTIYDPFRPMEPKPTTDITIVLDRSGSMEGIGGKVKKATIDGFNEFLNSQKGLDTEATITLVQFDDVYESVYKALPIDSAPKLTKKIFVPRGMTALNDAIGTAINDTSERLVSLPEADRPDNVIMVIITDGGENSSIQYTTSKVAEMISYWKTNYNWKFIFIGANQDAVLTGSTYNIPKSSSMSYNTSNIGTSNTFRSVGQTVNSSRLDNDWDINFTSSMRAEAMEDDNDA